MITKPQSERNDGPVVRLPEPHHGLLRVGPSPGRVQTEEAEEERLAGRVVKLGHVVGDDTDDVKHPLQSPPLPSMRVLHRQDVELQWIEKIQAKY